MLEMYEMNEMYEMYVFGATGWGGGRFDIWWKVEQPWAGRQRVLDAHEILFYGRHRDDILAIGNNASDTRLLLYGMTARSSYFRLKLAEMSLVATPTYNSLCQRLFDAKYRR